MRESRGSNTETADKQNVAEARTMMERLAVARKLHPGCTRFNGAFEPLDGPETRADEVELAEREFLLM